MTTGIFSKNQKMQETEKVNEGSRFVCFNLPAIKTCPNAGVCARFCYARQGRYIFQNVKDAQEFRFDLTKRDDFCDIIQKELDKFKTDKYNYFVRIHDSGDFYSQEYLNKWIKIAEYNKRVTFYAYTKMVSMMKNAVLPDNFVVIYSYGGKEDVLIDKDNDRHSKVFNDVDTLKKEGYVDATGNDMIAIQHKKVGLPYHGTKKMIV